MSHSILITGGSGYLGGTLLAHLSRATLPPHKRIYALVRSKEQAEAIKQYSVESLLVNLEDKESIIESIVDANISIIFFLIDAFGSRIQVPMIKALSEVKKKTGQEVHFLHTSGAKIFSEHVGFPIDRTILDTDPMLYELQKSSKPPHERMVTPMQTNNTIIEAAETYGVRSHIFVPCVVYGEGEGFGNRISIQTTAIVKAAKQLRIVYDVNPEGAIWPVCHVYDTATLYIQLLRDILLGTDLGIGKNGYYLASSGSVAWIDIYTAMAKSLAQRKVVDNEDVLKADDEALGKIAQALGCPKELVTVQIGGTCTLRSDQASKIGWTPRYPPQHILKAADAEVEFILKNLKDQVA